MNLFDFHLSDAVFIAKVIDFVVFVVGLVYLYIKVLRPYLERAQDAQNKQVEDAEASREASAQLVVTRQRELEQAKQDANRMVQVALEQAARLQDVRRVGAQEHAERILTHARGELDRERYRTRQELLLDTVDRAFARATQIAQRELDAATQARFVEGVLAQLEASRV